MAAQLGNSVQFEGYRVDASRWTLSWHDEPIALTRKSFDLLLYLIERRDRVVSKDDILNDLWPKQVVESSNLTQQIFLLRKALARHESGNEIIQTVAGRGYRFVANVDEPTPPPAQPHTIVFHEQHSVTRVSLEEEIDDGIPVVSTMSRIAPTLRLGFLAFALAIVAAGPFLWRYWQNRSSGPPVELVLADFDDNSGDASLGVALNDAIRIDLAQSPFVTVLTTGKVRATLVTMRQPVGTPVTPAVAREVCERNSAQVLLQGSLSKFGQRYLASLRASSCLTADVLAEDKVEIERQDDLPDAFDRLAATIRRHLGESRASISRFDKPLFPSHTGSLAALKAYSEGRRLYNRGDWAGSLALFRHAVELDPEFATAYLHIASVYYNFHDIPDEREALKKAYVLQDALTESNRLYLSAAYNHEVTGDLHESLNTYKAWVALYPNDKSAWGNLASAYDDLGQASLGIEAAQRTLAMDPSIDAAYQNLASIQLHSGQPAAALQTCQLAIERKLDNESLRDLMLQILYAQRNPTGVAAQIAWGRDHDSPLSLRVDEILLAIAGGQVRLAEELTRHLIEAAVPPERAADRASSLWLISRDLADAGYPDPSAAILKSQASAANDQNSLIAAAEAGESAKAQDGLREVLAEHGNETLWKEEKSPEVRAALLLAQHKPQDAVEVLRPAAAFEGLTSGPAFLRGLAYRDLHKDQLALVEFEKIARAPYIDPLSSRYSLAHLEMARLFARLNDTVEARAHYRQFLDLWRDADPDAPLLAAARREAAQIDGL